MEAKLKAEELFNKYCYAIRTEETDSAYWTNIIYAKNCALIAVDEILQYIGEEDFIYPSPQFEYWQEVKKEIEKL